MGWMGLAARLGGFAARVGTGLKASVAGRLFGQAAKSQVLQRAVRGGARAGVAVGGAVATGAAFEAGTQMFGGGAPGMPPALPQGVPGGAPAPVEGTFGRMVSRILPGGLSGREFTPYAGTETDKYGRPIAVYPAAAQRLVAPRGYVIVRDPNNPENALAILKGAARAMGLWSAKPKPPISGYDRRAIERASRVKKRMKKLARKVEKL